MSKYGLFFGEFYPITIAHTTLGMYMKKKLGLDKVVFCNQKPQALNPAIDLSKLRSFSMWRAIGDVRSGVFSSFSIEAVSHLEHIRSAKDYFNSGVKRPRKYTYICGVSHALRLAGDPEWDQIKKEVNIQVMCGSSGAHGFAHSLASIDSGYFLDRLNTVPNFENVDARILTLLQNGKYDDPYILQHLDPEVLCHIKAIGI